MKKSKGYMICSECKKKTNVKKGAVPEIEWNEWKCPGCDGQFYGQEFINWIADRISPSTSDDTTGRFVLRELVQNADDVEAELIIFQFKKDALYVYNDGYGFRSYVDGGPGDFDRISRVLAKPKEKEFYTSGNFGSGFQTVYLFTNEPEVHSHGKSFKYDPTIPKKSPLNNDLKIDSPYRENKEKKGAVFRFPWRTEKKAIVKKNGRNFFQDERIWKRWNLKARRRLYRELTEYLHDSLLCCQHLKKIRIYWDDGKQKVGYQVERDFLLRYIDYDGQIGSVKEGPGNGGFTRDKWKYHNYQNFRYYIGSDFVRNVLLKKVNLCTIVDDKRDGLKVRIQYGSSFKHGAMIYEEYIKFLRNSKAIKKSDIHILIPLFPWEERVRTYRKKSWSYSVIPLPKQSGNNFTLTAHLFPKQTREAFELHQERAKKEWLEWVLLSAARLYLKTYERYIQTVQKMKDIDDNVKQTMFLDYLPASKLGEWVNVSLEDTDVEIQIDEDIFGEVFSKEILLFNENWYKPLTYTLKKNKRIFSAIVEFPRDDTERWLLESMDFVTFSEAFLNHPRFKELKNFSERLKEKIRMTDEKFVKLYGGSSEIDDDEDSFYKENKEENGLLKYKRHKMKKEFIDKLIQHCLINNQTDVMKTIPIIPNKRGELCKPGELRKEPHGEFSVLRDIIPNLLYPHPDFEERCKKFIMPIEDPDDLLEGISENKVLLENNLNMLCKCYQWLEQNRIKLPEDISERPFILDNKGHIIPGKDLFWVPTSHHDLIRDFLLSLGDGTHLVEKSILTDFNNFICGKLKVKMFDYPNIIEMYRDEIEGKDTQRKKLQAVLVEGVLKGIDDEIWSISDLRELHFLPSNGILQIPSNTCLGSVNDKKIDLFLGSIDNHVQNIIKKDNKYVSILNNLRSGDLNTDFIGYVIDRIDRYAEMKKEEDGLCRLDDEIHRLISDCLNRLRKLPKFSIYQGILEKRILPIDYRGFIVLSTPPRWDQKGGERRLEKYERRWPWVKPDVKYLNEKANPVWASIRFLNLHNDFQDAGKTIIKEFGIEQLISKGGIPRALMIHFLIPKEDPETSFFYDDILLDFIGIEMKKDEIDELKNSFLPYLNGYYQDTSHETERVNTKDKPCLYDSKDIWRIPTEFAFKVDDDLEVLGYHNLHPNFSKEKGWVKNTLTNIGVVDRLEFEKLEKAIQRLIKEKRTKVQDRSILKTIILGFEEGIGKKEDWVRLSKIEWMPTIDGKRKKPINALFLNEEVNKIIGNCKLDSLVDDISLIEEGRKSWSVFHKDDFERLGLRCLPEFKELIMVWAEYQRNNLPPPPELFNYIEGNYKRWNEEFQSLDTSKIKYYCDSAWRDPMYVVMEESDDIPDLLLERFSFTEKHEMVLKWLRGETEEEGKPKIKVRDALDIIAEVPLEEYDSVWMFIISQRVDIDEQTMLEFKEKAIFLYDNESYPPFRVLIAPRGGTGLKHKGRIGIWLSLIDERIPGEIETILALGALEFDTIFMKNELLISLIENITKEDIRPGSALWSDHLSIFIIMMEKEYPIPPNLSFVPIERDHSLLFKPPNKVILKDENGIWELFEEYERLFFFNPILISKAEPIINKVNKWLRKCGAKDFKNIIKIMEEPELKNAEHEVNLTEVLKSGVERLYGIVAAEFDETDCSLIYQRIDGLKTVLVYSCENIIRRYEIDMTTIDGGPPIFIPEITADYYFDKGMNVIFLRKRLENPIVEIEESVKNEFNPSFDDRYRNNFWEMAVKMAFSQIERPSLHLGIPFEWGLVEMDANIKKLNDWWGGYVSTGNQSSFPTLDGDFWWPALGLEDENDDDGREDVLRKKINLKDKKMMFNIFSMATLLGTNVSRTQIKNFLDILNSKNLSFSEIFEMKEEEVTRKVIDHVFDVIDTDLLLEKDYPHLRRRIFDILVLRRALKDEEKGDYIMNLIHEYMEVGLSPEQFLTKGISGFGIPRFMKGFKGMFTGQIYFIVREMVRLGRKNDWESISAKKWQNIAFHAPSQVRYLISNIGGDIPSGENWREELARMMMQKIKEHKNLSGWYDVPFFIYYDEFCRKCRRGKPPKDCEMGCRQRW